MGDCLLSSLSVPGLERGRVTVSRSRYGVKNFLGEFGIVSGSLSADDVKKRTIDLLAALRLRTSPISIMLKYLFVTAATAIVNLVLVATNHVQIANASRELVPSIGPSGQDKLIVKDEKPARFNPTQRSDIKSIHQTLTEFYRGLNEQNVDRMARVAVLATDSDKEYLRRIFARLKSAGVDMSVEVQNIELVSLSPNNALVQITQVVKASGGQRAVKSQQSASVTLVKYRGRWRVGDTDTVMQSLDRER